MENKLPADTANLSPGLAARLLAYYEAFCSPEDERHLWLAAHASFPVALTSDLLYKLWLNFRHDEQGNLLDIPMIAVSDLLLSTLCRPTGHQTFEMPQDIRTTLLLYLKAQPCFGMARVHRLAHFLRFYLRENPRQLPSRAFARAQEFTCLAQLDPQAAAEQLLDAWNRQKNKERLRQMLAWSEPQAQLLNLEDGRNGHNPLSVAIQILRGIQHFQEGLQDKAMQELQALKGRARRERQEGDESIRMDIPQAVLERLPEDFFGERERERDADKALVKYAKIHLLFHHSLDKRKLLQQLFPEQNFPEDRPLLYFPWQSNLKDLGLAGEINYNIWAWDSSLPPELDRFVLTPKGEYFIVASRQEEVRPLLHRIYSQVGQEKVKLLAASSEEGAEPQLGAMMEGMPEPVFVRNRMNFKSVLLEIAEEEAGRIPFVELPDKSLPTLDPDILIKANQAGAGRYETALMLFHPGFKSNSPTADLPRMLETMSKARQNEGKLPAAEVEETKIYFTPYELLQQMGLLYESPEGGAWMPAQSPRLSKPVKFGEAASTLLRYTFEFLPQDLEWRLIDWLARAGAIPMEQSRPALLQLYGIPIEIKTNVAGRLLEIRIPHALQDDQLKDNSVFAQIFEYLGNISTADEGELARDGYNKAELIFEILESWKEAPFHEKVSALSLAWRKACEALLTAKEENARTQNLKSCRGILIATYNTLLTAPSKKFSIGKLAEKVIQTAKGIMGEGNSLIPSVISTYPYPVSCKLQTFDIPAHATPDMATVEGGTFQMGDVMDDNEFDREKPVHEVTLGSFALGRYPVTLQEYDAFCEATGREKPKDSGWGRENRPAIYVDWYDAIEYCNWLSGIWGLEPVYEIEKEKKGPNNQSSFDKKKWLVTPNWKANGYRLPTEAEWEYAARAVVSPSGRGQGGGKVRFGNGRDIADPKEINFNAGEQHKKPYSVAGEYRGKTTPVGSFPPNALGLYDMSGNVYDWCWDWFDENYYKQFENRPVENPTGPEGGSSRVLRGGSWNYYPQVARAAYRYSVTPDFSYYVVGFRLARTL